MIQHNHEASGDDRKRKSRGARLPKLLLTIEEAEIALSISERTIRDMTKNGELPCVRFGHGKRKSIRYDPRALRKWIDEQAAKSDGLRNDE